MRDVLEELLAELEGQRELAPLWASGELFLDGFTRGLEEARGLVREAIQVEKLGE